MNYIYLFKLIIFLKMDRHIPYNITHSNVFIATPIKIQKSHKLIKAVNNLYVTINKLEDANTKYDQISIKIKSCVT